VRLVALGLALALAAPAPLAAQTHAPTLVPGEVLIEVSAIGMVSTRADRATLSFSITGNGETEAAARASAAQKVREITGQLRAQGIAEADIRIEPLNVYAGDPVDPAIASAIAAMNAAAADAQRAAGGPVTATTAESPAPDNRPAFSATAAAEVVIRNVSNVPAVTAALSRQQISLIQGAVYTLNDDSGARRQARLQAMEKARASAETYALALNMRVTRVLRVTERLGMDVMALAASERSMGGFLGLGGSRGNGVDVPTVAVIGVDFALAPR
jgi:uncharacterized protein YggE